MLLDILPAPGFLSNPPAPACLLRSFFLTLLALPMPCLPHSSCPSSPATTGPPSVPFHPCPSVSVPTSILFIPIRPTLSLGPHPWIPIPPTPCPSHVPPSPPPRPPQQRPNPERKGEESSAGAKQGTPSMMKAMALGGVGLSEYLCWWGGDEHMVSPNHATPETLPTAPKTHLHYALCWVIPQWIKATSTTATATSPLPCHLEPADPGPQVQCPSSALAPLQGLWGGRAPCQLWQTDPRCWQDWGSVERGNALRPRTHFIPSHLYWISQISGLEELVYPIKLHCKGRLCPASLPEAMGCSVGQAGGPGWGGTVRGTSSPHITTASPKLSSH